MRIDLASITSSRWTRGALTASLALLPALAGAEEAAPTPDKGDTAFMMLSTLLVIMMAVPGLALFYGGMVRSKNMLSVLMQVLVVFSLLVVLWMVYGYSLAFNGPGAWIGDMSRFMLSGITPDTNAATFSDGVVIPELVFVAFQATFAAITTALAVGGFAERTKFGAVLIFAVLWFTFSYLPIARMVWYTEGYLFKLGALDFAGGTVVHINAGIAGLVGAIIVGKRIGYGTQAMPPHNLPFVMIGASMLWVGWFGFNVGSNLEANNYRRPRVPQHLPLHGSGGVHLDLRRVDLPRQADDARRGFGHDRGPRRHHPGLRCGGTGRRDRPRRDGGSDLPLVRRTVSRRCWATTTRWTCSVSTPSAASWVPS